MGFSIRLEAFGSRIQLLSGSGLGIEGLGAGARVSEFGA